jgi:hypothetical protein
MNRTHYIELYGLYKKELEISYRKIEELRRNHIYKMLDRPFEPVIPTFLEMLKDIFMDFFKIKDKDTINEEKLKEKIHRINYQDQDQMPGYYACLSFPSPNRNSLNYKIREKMAKKLYNLEKLRNEIEQIQENHTDFLLRLFINSPNYGS